MNRVQTNVQTNVQTDIQNYSARMCRYVTILWAACVTLVVLERFSAAAIRVYQLGLGGQPLRALACQAVTAIPEALFLWGLWWVRKALEAFARGELFAAPMTQMLDRVGVLLACGAAVRILIVPGVCRLLGLNPGYWIAIDTASLVLGAIGMALKAIAGVLRHASAIQSELDEIF